MTLSCDIWVVLKYRAVAELVTIVETNIKDSALLEVLTAYVQDQCGSGGAQEKWTDRDEYTIKIGLALADDEFACEDDCGDKALRLGILVRCLHLLSKNPKYREA